MGALEQISLWTILSVFGAGVLTAFTPCVYPILPVIIAYFGGNAAENRYQAVIRALFYVVGMAVVYAALGAVAAAGGGIFGVFQNSRPVKLIVANIFIFMGLCMLGVFTLPTISLVRTGSLSRGGGLTAAFMVGATSGLVAGPCTTPVLGALLAYAAGRRNIVTGTVLLFIYAVGMGVPLLVLAGGIGIARKLPRAGRWLEKMKKIFGLLLIAAGEYFLLGS